MADTIRVTNTRKFNVGVKLQNGIEHNIKPGGFVTLARADVDYIASIAPELFEGEKILRLDDREVSVENGFIDSVDDAPLDEEQIRKNLALSEKKMRAWLDGIAKPFLLDAIYDVAATMNLTAGKLKALQEKMPERDFLGADDPPAEPEE